MNLSTQYKSLLGPSKVQFANLVKHIFLFNSILGSRSEFLSWIQQKNQIWTAPNPQHCNIYGTA